MTSYNFKHINKDIGINKLFVMFACAVLCIAACLGWAVLGSNMAMADDSSPSGEVPSSLNFAPGGETGMLVPFTFWQKIDSPFPEDMEQTYTYVFYPIDEKGNKLDLIQPFPGEDPEDEAGDPVDDKEFTFTLTGNQEKTFYINFAKVDLLNSDKYFKEPYYDAEGSRSWNFYYRSQMIKPDSVPEHYTLDDTYFDVKIWIPYDALDPSIPHDKDLRVFCFNPIGQKVYDPGWTISYIEPETPSDYVTPQTIDPNLIIVIVAIVIFALCIVLAIAEKRKRNAAMQAAIQNAKNLKK